MGAGGRQRGTIMETVKGKWGGYISETSREKIKDDEKKL